MPWLADSTDEHIKRLAPYLQTQTCTIQSEDFMALSEMITSGIELFSTHPLIAIIAMAVILLLFYLNSKVMIRVVGIFLLFAGIYYILSLIGDSVGVGVDLKRKMFNNTP